jgi:hypothetical protein
MMLRDRHHPSVFMWGMGNESRSFKGYTKMNALIREIDPSRPSTYAENHLYRGRRHKTLDLPDVLGVNYELDVMDEARDVSRNKVVLVTECSNNPNARRGDLEEEARQIEVIRQDLDKIQPYPFNAGYMLWCMNDYSTLRKERYKRYSGLIDAWRVPKASWAYHRLRHSGQEAIEAFGHWGDCEPDDVRPVLIVGSVNHIRIECGEETLVIEAFNGVGLYHLPFQDAPLRITGGSVTCTLDVYGAPEMIDVTVSEDDSARCMILDIRVTDSDGRTVQDYHGFLNVRHEGKGMPGFYRPDDVVLIRSGQGRLFYFRPEEADSCILGFSADGLQDVEIRNRWSKSARIQI